MPDPTPNHSYNRPDLGVEDWHLPINENFSFIESDMEIRDTEDNLQAYTPYLNAKFVAVDTRNIYLGDGSQWNIWSEYPPAPNLAPTADFSWSPTTDLDAGETITFDGGLSTDPEGQSLSYAWDFGDGTTGTGQVIDHVFEAEGNYNVTLTVTDAEGATDSTTQTVSIGPVNQAPTADFTFSPVEPFIGEEVSFDGTLSSDPDGTIQTYQWDFGDGTTATGATVTHTYSSGGDFTVQLTVTDDDGATSTASMTITVISAVLVESFEDQDLSEYVGDTTVPEFDDTVVQHGVWSLFTDGNHGSWKIVSTSGLPAYPAQGDTFSVWFQTNAVADQWAFHFIFGAQDLSNNYYVRYHDGRQDEGIFADVNDSDTEIASVDFDTMARNEPHEFEVAWALDGTITATLMDSTGASLGSVSVVDTTYTAGGVGFFVFPRADGGDQFWVDELAIK